MDNNIVAHRTSYVVSTDALPVMGWTAGVAATWAGAGGAAGGALVAAFLLSGRMHPDGAVPMTLLLATAGSLLGLVHGAVLGFIGRHAGGTGELRTRDRAFAVFVATAAVLASIALALWLVLSSIVARAGSAWGWLAFAIGTLAALAVAAQASVIGWHSLMTAFTEWPQHRLGFRLVAGSFTTITLVLLALRPALPGTSLQLPMLGWILVAGLATIWIATPGIIVALRLRRTR
ncbi:MAG TPA: hypothetical protein VK929_00455 [Longimicrobiales bacterium]|nr:hypothetical protein [Longimicrobiales bacterium]